MLLYIFVIFSLFWGTLGLKLEVA